MSAVNYSGPHRNKRQCLCIIWGSNEGTLWEMCKCRMSSCISWLFMKIAYHLLTSMDWKFGNNEVASVITWSDKECIDIFRTNVPMNDYHTVKYRKIAPSLPEIFSKIIFRFTSPKFSLATSQSVEWRGGGGCGGGRVGNSHISYKSELMGACRLAWGSNDFLPKISLKDVGREIAT